VNAQFYFARALERVQNFKTAPAAFAFDRIVRISQGLQFIQDKARDNERAAQKTGSAKIGDASVNDNICIDDERFVLGGLAGKNARTE